MKLSIASWNVNEIYHKPDMVNKQIKTVDPLFKNYIKNHDIVGLLETKVGVNDKITMDGYVTCQIGRQKSKNNRFFGGICIAVKKEIYKGTTVLKTKGETEFVWIKLDKNFFNIQRDYYICFVYVSPDKSGKSYGIDVYDRVANSLAHYMSLGSCMIFGDMNAHTNQEHDFIANDYDKNNRLDLPDDYFSDIPMRRRNSDLSKVNDHGKALLDLCTTSGFRIMNGRKIGDMFGACTYFGPMCKNPTLIDYGLAHKDNFKDISYFKVQDLNYLSDHCLIFAQIEVNPRCCATISTETYKVFEIPQRFMWEANRSELFVENLQNFKINEIQEILKRDFEPNVNGVDKITSSLTDIIIGAAEKTFRKSKVRKAGVVIKKQYARHMDKECLNLLRQLKKMSREVSKNPRNCELRKSFYHNKRRFKALVKNKLEEEKESLVRKLSTKTDNPKEFWKILDKIQKISNDNQSIQNNIAPSIWVQHFKDLMCKEVGALAPEQEVVTKYIENKANWCVFNELSFSITEKEIMSAIKNLKSGKACGADLISNEMLKCIGHIILPVIKKLFNKILQTGHYPTLWRYSWLKVLHKGGDINDPKRYRGIAIMSCLGKLFCSVLNNRLVAFLKDEQINSKFQIGFTENCRTADHVLTLKTLIDKYTKENKKMYACYIDFRNAFDNVWRNGLLFKMLKHGVGGQFGKIIQDMYNKTMVQIKLESGLTEAFNGTVGVKQGCVLSPTLFKLYVNDLPDIFNEKCSPVSMLNKQTNCLLFADDIIILSETKEGLQNALNKLHDYCLKWRLIINPDKSKVMIFNKSGRLYNEVFTIGTHLLENVKEYAYLGMVFTPNGNFNLAIHTLNKKAKKAMFKVRNTLFKANLSPRTSLHVYDTLVRPISTYCSEVWGAFVTNLANMFKVSNENYKLYDEPCFEKTNLNFAKTVLGVHKRACNAAVRGELGRYPMVIYIIKQVLKNLSRIVSYDVDSLLFDAYLCNWNLTRQNKNCWLSKIKELVCDTMKLNHFWENQVGKPSMAQINTVTKKLKYIYEFHWSNEIHRDSSEGKPGNKMRTYALFKKIFRYENYLDFHPDFRKRRMITKLRISAHKLEIEMGRYQSKSVRRKEPKERLCKQCDLKEMEDEKHLVMSCPKYSNIRNESFHSLDKIFPGFSQMCENEKFVFLMCCEDFELFSKLVSMIEQISSIRGSI